MKLLAAILGVLIAVACNPDPTPTDTPTPPINTPSPSPTPSFTPGPIQHVVVIIQENRTFDNLYQGYPNADVQSWGVVDGQTVNLQPESLTANFDPRHQHSDALNDYNGGSMDGWNHAVCQNQCPPNFALSYVPQSEVQPYWDLAAAYTLADKMFQSNQGPSYPAHQWLASGTSSVSASPWPKAAENGGSLGCDAPPSARVTTIDSTGSEAGSAYPCFHRSSIFGRLDTAGLTWRYYQSTNTLWEAPRSIYKLFTNTSEYSANVITPPSQFLTDIANGNLASVTYITPTNLASDHALSNNGSGPAWVASVVNAIGNSQYWNSTSIFLTWDDWGGWYDHVAPPQVDAYASNFRVPLLCIGPYAHVDYVDHTQHSFGSILHYIESTFNLPSMGTEDATADDLSSCFDYTQAPTTFTPVNGSRPRGYWNRHQGMGAVDN